MPKGIPIGFEMAEKKVYTQTHTDRQFRIYISRDIRLLCVCVSGATVNVVKIYDGCVYIFSPTYQLRRMII